MARVAWTDESQSWLRDIFDYIAADNPEAAARTVQGIFDRAQALADAISLCCDWVLTLNMATSKDDIFRAALTLPEKERADLIGALFASLDSEVEAGVEAAWRLEIERRARELDSGAVQCIPWDVVKERLARAAMARPAGLVGPTRSRVGTPRSSGPA